MNDEKYYYVTVTQLHEDRTVTYYAQTENADPERHESRTRLTGYMYFDGGLIDVGMEPRDYAQQRLYIGKIELSPGDKGVLLEGIAYLEKRNINDDFYHSEVHADALCDEVLFKHLLTACNDSLQIRVHLALGEWDRINDETHTCTCTAMSIEVGTRFEDETYFAKARTDQARNQLLTQICGGYYNDLQLPDICNEFATAFASNSVFLNRHELYAEICSLIHSIRMTFDSDKSALRKEIENSEHSDLRHLYYQTGETFHGNLAKLPTQKNKHDVLREYNTFWKQKRACEIFETGYEWNGDQITSIADKYLKISHINSPTLNAILVDGLLLKDLANMASEFQYSKRMSPEAILSVKGGDYNETEIEARHMTPATIIGREFVRSSAILIRFLINGGLAWGIASFFGDGNDLAHYAVFSALFAAFIVASNLREQSHGTSEKKRKEEECFYILRDFCNLHTQAKHMNVQLLKSRMYSLEARGVLFDPYIYTLLDKAEKGQ